ncbi:MAG TPA: glycosyltransferase family 1 protein [Chloroflexi bacterium]|nr:glycosyltransferase family 1 protein [Chloroflexota bacterium]
MRILMPTIGTRGDLQPYVALALGLQARGHRPTLATHPLFRSLVESYCLDFAPIGPDIDLGREVAIIRGRSPNWVAGFLRVMRFTFSMLEQAYPDLLALARQTDLMVVSHTAAGSIEADALDLPRVSVTLMPQAIPAPDPQAPLWKRALGGLAGAGMGLVMTRPLNQIRQKVGLPPMGQTGITSPSLNLIPLSPLVSPPDPRWEPRHRVTGYWFAPAPESWTPPDDLARFLEAGPPPVVVSLGAMAISGNDAREAAEVFVRAIQQAGVRAILQGWEEPLSTISLPESILPAGSIPHEWLLPRASAFIHHGGFGSTSAGLRAGIPSMAVPHIIDQFLWGNKLHELGVGPKPIPRGKLKVEPLAAALRELVDNPEMKARSAELGEAVRGENGVEAAVGLIEGVFQKASHV